MSANQTSGRSLIGFFRVILCLFLMYCGAVYAQSKATIEKNATAFITIEQKVPGNIFYESEAKEVIIRTQADSVEWECFDYWGKKAIAGKSAVVDHHVTLHLEPKKLGWFKLVVHAKQHQQNMALKQTSFAVVASFDLGVVSNSAFIGQLHAWQPVEVLIPILKKMGVKYVRDAIRWDAIESRKQVYKFSEKQDRFMALLAANNLKPFLVFALYNTLYDNGLSPVSGEARLAFANYVKQVLGKYPAIDHLEVWNEPDIGTFSKGLGTDAEKTDFYFNLLKTTYQEVHPLFPKVKVSGFVISDQASDSFLRQIFQKGALKYMDEYSFHSYVPVPESIVPDIERHQSLIKSFNQGNIIPINLSETGFTTYTFTEAEQANYLPRRIVAALASGIQKLSIYNLQNKSTLNDSEGAFGLIRHQDDTLGAYTPKPAFATHAALTRELTGAAFVEQEAVSPGLVYCYKFKKGETDVRVMYSLSGTGVNLYTSAKSINVVDVMGNSKTYKPVNGIVALTLDRDPVYVKGVLTTPFVKEFTLAATQPVNLTYGFYLGGYTEFPKNREGVKLPDSVAAVKWLPGMNVFGPEGKKSRVISRPVPLAKVTWQAAITIPGMYKVMAYIPANTALTTKATPQALYAIYAAGNKTNIISVDQFKNQGKWVDLGTYKLLRGTNNYVELSDGNPAHDQPLRADVVKYQLIY
jgi:hypothetical protein